MKTKKQITNNCIDIYNIDKYVDECTEGLNNNVKEGLNSYECIIGTYSSSLQEDKIIAKKLANKLVTLGFYAQYGCRETTSSGSERAIVRVSLNQFEKQKIKYHESDFFIIISFLITIVWFFYIICNY